MSNQSSFSSYPSPSLNRADVIGYLSARKIKGWNIYQGNSENQFIIRVTDNQKVFIDYKVYNSGNKWCVLFGDIIEVSGIAAFPENLAGLDQAVTMAVREIGRMEGKRIDWSSSLTSIRLYKDEPATNFSKLVGLISTSTIEAVFDPYLDNKGLDNILTIVKFGVSISHNLRLLTSSKVVSRLTKSYIQSWFKELNCSGEIRQLKSDKEHRRFMLLSGGQSLIIGLSLNDISKNEAAHLESDTQDLTFFDSEWNTASKIPGI